MMRLNGQRIFAGILGIASFVLVTFMMREKWKGATKYSSSKSNAENIVPKLAQLQRDPFVKNLHGMESTVSNTSSTPTSTISLEDAIRNEQERRQEILQAACQSLNISRPVEYSHMLVSDPHKILFNFIPKVSCKSWKELWSQLRKLNGTGNVSLGKYSPVERQYRLANYRKVLFVREPLSRILSAYMSKFRGGALYDHAPLQRYWENAFGVDIVQRYRGVTVSKLDKHKWLNITFPELILYVTDLGSGIRMTAFNDHWFPQHIVSHPCQIKYDFIGHFENLSVEGPYVLRWLGIDHLVQLPEYHNSNAAESLVEYYKKIPLELFRKLGDYYLEDYRLFGYSLEETIGRVTRGVFQNDARR